MYCWSGCLICRTLNEDVISVADARAPIAVWRSVRALPEFWRLLELRTVSQFGDGLFQAGLAGGLLFNPERAAGPWEIAGAFAVLFLPYSLLGPFAGALLDRWTGVWCWSAPTWVGWCWCSAWPDCSPSARTI